MKPESESPAPVVLLRGLTRGRGHWAWFADELQRSLGSQRVCFIDLPGNGDENQLTSPLSISENLGFLRERIKDLNLAQPFHLLAISMGGMVAYEWSRQYPEELRSLALINSSFRGISSWHRRLRPSAYPDLARIFLTPNLSQVEWGVLRLVVNDPDIRSKAYKCILPYSMKYSVSRKNFIRQILAASRFRAEGKPPIPTLLMASRKDRLVSYKCSEAASERWGVALQLHSEAGHDLPLDDSPWVLKTYTEFLTGI